jgi:hypothetical protein
MSLFIIPYTLSQSQQGGKCRWTAARLDLNSRSQPLRFLPPIRKDQQLALVSSVLKSKLNPPLTEESCLALLNLQSDSMHLSRVSGKRSPLIPK